MTTIIKQFTENQKLKRFKKECLKNNIDLIRVWQARDGYVFDFVYAETLPQKEMYVPVFEKGTRDHAFLRFREYFNF